MDSGSTPTHQQQFCLRWHNHQTSLLSSLPLLLDQSHLTDVTLSAEGKTLRAHRVVLIIVIPGASFGAVVALLTFMYSGEVNVFEEQIPTLLTLAETLGIKGLADFHNNNSSKSPKTEPADQPKETESPSSASSKMPSPLENFFMKSLQFYPNLMPQPLNFSQSALNKTSEFIAKYQQHCNLMQQAAKENDSSLLDENSNKRSNNSTERKFKEMKKIDKIAENLRSATTNKPCIDPVAPKLPMKMPHSPPSSLALKPPPFPPLPHHFMTTEESSKGPEGIPTGSPHPPAPSYSPPENLSTSESLLEKTISGTATTKTPNAKLYATCFICHKQLSNQYNLRVHLETHQNVRYACNVCSHVSRSKDALRKHVSYRHPGAPSPCESETRRKRSKTLAAPFHLMKPEPTELQSTASPQTPSNQPFMFLQNQFHPPNGSPQSTSAPTTPGTPTSSEITNTKKESTNSEIADSV
ncbi:broad-complex core protein isoforms 1/2/3/4/5 isoform X2 [Hermetia illucens]|uniref:broad-complex core protein isoforms 1/2/3/4/5 isoform X2 n=1 Tax=Hermetia illucens TaxID=343691 RepID=UPI0018CC47A4|nr:broad-complex core protein isoforms 1/2/3/4/5 isoform X2 [Hermetia illucens]